MCAVVGILMIVGSFLYLGRALLGGPAEPGTLLLALAFVTIGIAGLYPRIRR